MKTGFVCFGEINTPYDRLKLKHDDALAALEPLGGTIIDAGIVIDDSKYESADKAISLLKDHDFSCLICCVAGWIPSHAVIRVTDAFRHIPMVLWGLCGWMENGHLVTTADQAGTTALRAVFSDMGYRFKYVYSIVGEPKPISKIDSFLRAAYTATRMRQARIGTMGYRDMLLYGTQFEGSSLRKQIGAEVEPFEMLEMVQLVDTLDSEEIDKGVNFVKENWLIEKPCDDAVIRRGVSYALAIGKKIKERNLDAITLIDVDGMKKLLGFPPAIVFMLIERWYGIPTIPENDVMGSVSQLLLTFLTKQTIPYMEYYEFFKNSMLIGVPDYVPQPIIDGSVRLLPAGFGLLSASLLNVSKVKTGYLTCTRLIYQKGEYSLHMYTGEAKQPMKWEECGWDQPAPQLPSLEVFPDSCTVEEFAQRVSSQHVIFCYGDETEALRDLCYLLNIHIV